MKVPQIQTTEGLKPCTVLPNAQLVFGFLQNSTEEEDLDLVRLLDYAVPDPVKSGYILRRCLEGKTKLIAVYPAKGEEAPKGAEFIANIDDGALYSIYA